MSTHRQPHAMPRFDHPRCAARPDLPWLGGGSERQVRACIALCCQCRHLIECGRWAQDNDEPAGVWGGLSMEQRERLHAARARLPQLYQADVQAETG